MRKIKNIYLNSNDRVVLVDIEGKHYMIDHEDFIDPRWQEIDKGNIDYEKE